ncbi:DUF916 and DUF3324 domain-containing protein [Pseudolactococcus piscium]|nr:DUF916 and DUF3324 domain-containing protein [Lactococcus piscium]
MRKHKIYLLLFMVIFFLQLSVRVSASEMKFSVQAVIPENQIDKNQSYFDLKMSPGQIQDLKVNLYNDTDKDVTINIISHAATTNQNGVVEYNTQNNKKDDTLKIAFQDIAKTEEEVTVGAKSKKQILVHLVMPKDSYDGVVLGGLYFTEKITEDNTKNANNGQVINRYAYVIGVKLTETETKVSPELKLNEVKASQINYRNFVTANIQNYKPAIIKDLSIDGKIFKKGDSKVLYSDKRQSLKMAPNSNFDYAISLRDKPFKPGKYTFKGTAKSDVKQWNFEKDFEIKGEAAKSFNKKSVYIKKDFTWMYYLLIGLLLISLLVTIFVLLKKLSSLKDSLEE